MSVNSSSYCNASLPPSSPSSPNMYFFTLYCLKTTAGILSVTTFTIVSSLVLLPLYIPVLYLGVQRWRQKRSSTTTTHSDIFTYHMIVIELVNVFGGILTCCGVHTDHSEIVTVGVYLLSINLTGQMLFHILTCVERYLAVIHPITYLSLRKAKGIRIRNVTIGCVWLLCFAGTGFMSVGNQVAFEVMSYCIYIFALTVIIFCSLSVLYVLIIPGPGDGGGGRQQVDQSKLRAFYAIMLILGVLLLKFLGKILSTALYDSLQLEENEMCAVYLSFCWLGMPSSLVLPVLFLQRAGKLQCCKSNKEHGSRLVCSIKE